MEHLIAKDGYSYVNDGIISKDVYCPSKKEAANWVLMTDEEAAKIKEDKEEEMMSTMASDTMDMRASDVAPVAADAADFDNDQM